MKVHIYAGKVGAQKGRWRWRVIDAKGEVVATSGKGYRNKSKAYAAWAMFSTAKETIELVIE